MSPDVLLTLCGAFITPPAAINLVVKTSFMSFLQPIITSMGNSLHLLTHPYTQQLLASGNADTLQESYWLFSAFLIPPVPDLFAKQHSSFPHIGKEAWQARFASGSIPISCHIIWCFVRVTLTPNGEAAPAAAVIRKNVYRQVMFSSAETNGTPWSLLN